MAANWAKTQFVKLLSNKRKAAEEGLNSLLRMDVEIAKKRIADELFYEEEVAQAAALSADFFKASVSSRTANSVFSSASTSARNFSSVSVQTRSFLGFPTELSAMLSLLFFAKWPLALCNEVLISLIVRPSPAFILTDGWSVQTNYPR